MGSLTVFDLEVQILGVALVCVWSHLVGLCCGLCACDTDWRIWHSLTRTRCLQMEEVAGPRPQTARLQNHLRFVQSKLAPLVNPNEIAELRV